MPSYRENVYNMLKRRGLAPTFDHAGIYRIAVDGIIVYIGKSINMMKRLAEHYVSMKNPTEHKYIVLAEVKRRGHQVNFNKLYDAQNTRYADIVEEIGEAEGYFIRKYRPPLNAQIPREKNWRKFEINRRAKTITVDELLEGIQQ